MTNSTEVIILSSSPNTSPRIPTRVTTVTEKAPRSLPEGASTPSAPSPAQLFIPPSRSRFFDAPTRKKDAPRKKRATTKKATSSEDNDASRKPRQRSKRGPDDPTQKPVNITEPEPLDSGKTATKKTGVSQKDRAKPKAKKSSGNLKLAGKVTKAGTSKDQAKTTREAGPNRGTEQQASGNSTEASEPPAPSNALGKDEILNLEGAMRRRRDWTPPTETSPHSADAIMNDGTNPDKIREPDTNSGFGSTLTGYEYSGSSSDSREVSANEGGPTKRRRIELVDPQCQPIHSRLSKQDSAGQEDVPQSPLRPTGRQLKTQLQTQRRFTTLTARMTAQYTLDDTVEGPLTDKIARYLTKPTSRAGNKKSSNQDPELIVLSPDAAFKALDQQDVVFGTCSQLERDDSPETIREMQRAIRASESLAHEEREADLGSGQDTSSGSTSRPMSRLAGARNLWGLAGRDTGGCLVQAQIVDKIDLTEVSDVNKKENTARRRSNSDESKDDWIDLDDGKPRKSTSTRSIEAPIESDTQVTIVLDSSGNDPQPAKTQSGQTSQVSNPVPMPNYNGFTDAELSRQVAVYGFKSVKGRKKMIDLLQKCWESKHGKAAPTVDASCHSMPTSRAVDQTDGSVATPKTPDSKPKAKTKAKKTAPIPKSTAPASRTETAASKRNPKQTSKTKQPPPSSYIDVEEIQDSEEEAFLSPSQVQNRYIEIFSNTQTPSLEIQSKNQPQSPSKPRANSVKTLHASKSTSAGVVNAARPSTADRGSLPDLSTQITKAVHAQSQLLITNRRSRPTWHEKILMYDPIILEDFTSWLNVEGLGRIGEDREVGMAAVREWCEGKGICCCWKKNASW